MHNPVRGRNRLSCQTSMQHDTLQYFRWAFLENAELLYECTSYKRGSKDCSPGDMVWSDNHDGSGKNWLGLQLMLLRDQIRGEERWSSWLKQLGWSLVSVGKIDVYVEVTLDHV